MSSAIVALVFSAGTDSPVSMDSSALNSMVLISLRSAGTRPPEASKTMSPGTTSSPLISISLPSRSTRALATTILLRARTFFSALYSWMKPTMALINKIARITPVSLYSSRKAVTTAAMRRI